jgi:hypothetical protein
MAILGGLYHEYRLEQVAARFLPEYQRPQSSSSSSSFPPGPELFHMLAEPQLRS